MAEDDVGPVVALQSLPYYGVRVVVVPITKDALVVHLRVLADGLLETLVAVARWRCALQGGNLKHFVSPARFHQMRRIVGGQTAHVLIVAADEGRIVVGVGLAVEQDDGLAALLGTP